MPDAENYIVLPFLTLLSFLILVILVFEGIMPVGLFFLELFLIFFLLFVMIISLLSLYMGVDWSYNCFFLFFLMNLVNLVFLSLLLMGMKPLLGFFIIVNCIGFIFSIKKSRKHSVAVSYDDNIDESPEKELFSLTIDEEGDNENTDKMITYQKKDKIVKKKTEKRSSKSKTKERAGKKIIKKRKIVKKSQDIGSDKVIRKNNKDVKQKFSREKQRKKSTKSSSTKKIRSNSKR